MAPPLMIFILVYSPVFMFISLTSKSPEIVVIAKKHKEFKNIIPQINESGCKLIYDVWSMFNSKDFPNTKYVKFGEGI